MTEDLPPPPTIGPHGFKVATCEISQEQECERFRVRRPTMPCRELYEWDDCIDGLVFVRNRTDEEMAKALAGYKEALAKWEKSGGVFVRPGPVETSCTVKFVDGSTGEAFWTGTEWRWKTISR
jgi:hypothetical protein